MPKAKSTAVEIDDDFDLTPPIKKKRPVMDLDDDEPVSTALVPVTKKKKAVDKAPAVKPVNTAEGNLANLRTIFGEDAEEMVELMESEDNDSAISKLNKRLIQSSINLIAQVEKGIHDSNGRYGVHSYNGLVQTIRELVIDMQSTKDRGALGVTITENILRPAFLDMAMELMQEYAKVAHEVKDTADDETYKAFRRAQLESRDRFAAFMQESYGKIKDEMIKFLQR
jgi:hypothetical protein